MHPSLSPINPAKAQNNSEPDSRMAWALLGALLLLGLVGKDRGQGGKWIHRHSDMKGLIETKMEADTEYLVPR